MQNTTSFLLVISVVNEYVHRPCPELHPVKAVLIWLRRPDACLNVREIDDMTLILYWLIGGSHDD